MTNFFQRLGLPEKLISDPSYQKIIEMKQETEHLQLQNFFNDDIHKWTWWLNLGMVIIPFIIWWKIVDRKRMLEISLYGALIIILATFLDVSGSTLNLWDYPDKLLPNLPMLPVDFVVIPVIFMLVYQKYRPWLSFIAASTVVSAVFSFIAEPIIVWLNLDVLLKWKNVYSFPIYILMAIIMRWAVERLIARQI